jgi:hypothetical protein
LGAQYSVSPQAILHPPQCAVLVVVSTHTGAAPRGVHAVRPAAQERLHAPATQTGVPFSAVGHCTQLGPHWLAESSGTQAPPQMCAPVGQVATQLVPSQVMLPLVGGAGHALHDAPQLSTALLLTQAPLHRCAPGRQLLPQLAPSQVAAAFAGTGQGVHALPQPSRDVLLRQVPLQLCVPDGQAVTQLMPSQLTVPLCGATQGVHALPQVFSDVLLAHCAPHGCVPVGHLHLPCWHVLPLLHVVLQSPQ